MLLQRLALALFGLEVLGYGTVAGSGNEVIGIVHHIQVLFGYRIGMLFVMENMCSFEVDGDEKPVLNLVMLLYSVFLLKRAMRSMVCR
jgi:hypothetical protein